ncbi:MAG: O-antigen ligase family protein, partial [Candidatus Thiodiazotropha sp.]
AVYGNLASGSWHAESIYGGVGDFSTYLVTLLPMLLLLAYYQYKNRAKLTLLFSFLAAILFLLAALLTKNLMFWICFLVQLLALPLLGMRGRGRLKLAIGLVAAGIALSGLVAVGVQKSRITSFTPQGMAAMFIDDPRVQHWTNVVRIIRQQPFRGDGFGRAALSKAHPEVVISNNALWHSHNLFLDATIQMGVQGALALLLLFGCLVWRFNRLRLDPDRELHVIGVAGLVLLLGILSKSMTDNFFYRHLSLLFWAETGMLLGLGRGLLLAKRAEGEFSRETGSSPEVS